METMVASKGQQETVLLVDRGTVVSAWALTDDQDRNMAAYLRDGHEPQDWMPGVFVGTDDSRPRPEGHGEIVGHNGVLHPRIAAKYSILVGNIGPSSRTWKLGLVTLKLQVHDAADTITDNPDDPNEPYYTWTHTDVEIIATPRGGAFCDSWSQTVRVGVYLDGTQADNDGWSLKDEAAMVLLACITQRDIIDRPGFGAGNGLIALIPRDVEVASEHLIGLIRDQVRWERQYERQAALDAGRRTLGEDDINAMLQGRVVH